MKAEEAERFYEEDEDADEVFATFDAPEWQSFISGIKAQQPSR
jgi:hypothetical protein